MELFRNPNIDFLSKKWIFLGMSLVLLVAGLASIFFWHGIPLGVDFKGGTLVYVKFAQSPHLDTIRKQLDQAGLKNARIQSYGQAANNEVLIALELKETSEAALDQGKTSIIKALELAPQEGKLDLNNNGYTTIQRYLIDKDPLRVGTDAEVQYGDIARKIVDYRDKQLGGVLGSMDQLSAVVSPQVVASLNEGFYTSSFAVRNVEIVGPQVGKQLQRQAVLATLYSLIGMLVYLWFRFELIYGVAAVVAVFHDTLITIGLFSILKVDISLTVIAAILTLVGYSMNDTIVVFDRIRENVKLLRRDSLKDIVNKSINQTLSRTVLTSGLTFLTVLALFVFGGEVLHGFSLALVIGILIGTYSSIFIASPMLVAYQDWRATKLPNASVAQVETKKKDKRAKVTK